MPQESSAAPGVADDLCVWATVGKDEDGILFLRIEVRRLDDAGVELHAIVGFHAEKFRRREMEIGKLGDFVFVDRGDARSVGAVKILTRRGSRVRKSINEGRRIRRENCGVRAFVLGQACKT